MDTVSNLNRMLEQLTAIGEQTDMFAECDPVVCKAPLTVEKNCKSATNEYRCVINTIREGFWLIDRNGCILDVNDSFSGLVGYSRNELLTMSIYDLEALDGVADTAWQIDKIIEAGGDSIEGRYRCKDGSTVDLEISATYIPDSDRIVSFARNVTWRKKFDRALQKSHDRYIKLLYSVTDYIYTVKVEDGKAVSTTHGSGCLAVTGYAPGDWDRDPSLWISIVFEEDRQVVLQQIDEIISGRGAPPIEHRIRHRDGTLRWVKNTPVPSYDRGGKLVAYDGLISDITAHKRAEEALKNSEMRLAELIDFLPDATMAIDLEGKITLWNRAAEEMTGFKAADMLGKDDYEYAIPFYGERRPILLDLVLKSAEEIEQLYPYVKREGGKVIGEGFTRSLKRADAHMLGIAAPLYDAKGNIVGAIEAVRDITEWRQLEEQLRQAQKIEAIGVLAGGVAHDFNNIIQAIIANLHLLKKRLPYDSEMRLFAEEIQGLSDRASDLTTGLLAFSRKQIITPTYVNLNDIVRDTGKILRRLIGEDIELCIKPDAEAPVVMVDPGQIQQVMMNLATNSRDAMPKGGVLTISTRLTNRNFPGNRSELEFIQLRFEDTGIGIEHKDLPHIFEPFYTTKEVGKGTGLGLSVAYGIIRQHHGYVEIESRKGEGTTIDIYLPLSQKPVADELDNETDAVTGGSETILMVEDDEGVRKSVQRLLTSVGYGIIEAKDGKEGLRLFNENQSRIDLVLLDVVMPGMSGKEVCEEIRKIDKTVRAIFMSGYPKDMLDSKELGEIEYVRKPIMPDDLLRKIRSTIDS
jgi:two-component system, cell cycle sensor histidine kinase and response regulator CckA